jgi:hypothetical protein
MVCPPGVGFDRRHVRPRFEVAEVLHGERHPPIPREDSTHGALSDEHGRSPGENVAPHTSKSLLARHRDDPRVRVRETDKRFAKQVGQILYEANRGSEAMAGAHVVALCADAEAAVVFTTDPTDIVALSAVVPGTRIITRRP